SRRRRSGDPVAGTGSPCASERGAAAVRVSPAEAALARGNPGAPSPGFEDAPAPSSTTTPDARVPRTRSGIPGSGASSAARTAGPVTPAFAAVEAGAATPASAALEAGMAAPSVAVTAADAARVAGAPGAPGAANATGVAPAGELASSG